MHLFKFISVKLTIALILGIVIGFYAQIGLSYPFLVLFFLLLAIAMGLQKRNGLPFFEGLAVLTTVALGIFVVTLSQSKYLSSHYTKQQSTENATWELKVTAIVKPTTYYRRYLVKAMSIDHQKVTGTLLLNSPLDIENLQIDDELVVVGTISSIAAPRNPHQFNYKSHLEKKGIYHQIHTHTGRYLKAPQPAMTVFGIAQQYRQQLIEKLQKESFGKNELSIIQALLLGQRNDISAETYTNYKDAGAVHILAISGLHIGIFLLLLQFFLKPMERIRYGKPLKLVLIVALLWAFAFLSGLSPSVVRAVTMFSFLAYALHLNRPTNTFNTIALSMFFILLVNPLFLFQVGFQMSYAAVFSIVWLHPKLQRFWYPDHRLARKIWQLFSVSIAAQLGVLPISLFYFHQFPALFFISNLLIVPFLGILLGFGILVLLLTSFGILPKFLALTYNFMIGAMNTVVEWVAQQESFVFRDISFDGVQLTIAYFLIIALVHACSRPNFRNIAFTMAGVITLQSWALYQQVQLRKNETVVVAHQTANSILIHQKGNHLQVYSTKENKADQIISDYKIAERIVTIAHSPLQNSYVFNGKTLFVMDSTKVYPPKVDYLLLTQSPKINLSRLLDRIAPDLIIADGSNYSSTVRLWKETCLNKKIAFHATAEKGAFCFENIE
ncbi:MAG: ComEC/Rec2 family competence protein [Bacteroidota bacterium]